MKNNFNKYFVLATLGVSALTMSSCFEGYKEDLIDHVNPEASIYTLRSNYKGQEITISEATLEGAQKIGGVVVSNHENKNLPSNTISIQSTWRGKTRGILVEVSDDSKYTFGDSLSLELVGAKLLRKNGALMISDISSNKIEKVSSGHIKPYAAVAITTLKSKLEEFESTLVNITADVDPEPTNGATFSGVKQIIDGEGNKINLVTEANASFANEKIAPSATFQGIVLASNDGPEIRLQKAQDMMYPSGKLYAGWPESFEEPYQGKTSYNVTATQNLLNLTTGTWYLLQSIQGETVGRDRIVTGKQSLRFQQNLSSSAYAQMNFDVPNGASKVTFWYGAYYTDRSSTFQLEYSIDQGKTWKIVGSPIKDAHPTSESLVAKQAVFLVDINQPVRFRINKLGLGTSSNTIANGRLGVDDFAIYQGY